MTETLTRPRRAALAWLKMFPAPCDWWTSAVLLGMRVAIGRVFFLSGLVKIDDWDSTRFLFATEYKVPLLPPDLSAAISATFELGMPILLVLGLCARPAALPLIGMTLVIHFVVGGANPTYRTPEHFLWLLLLIAIVVQGAGRIALDEIIWPRVFGSARRSVS